MHRQICSFLLTLLSIGAASAQVPLTFESSAATPIGSPIGGPPRVVEVNGDGHPDILLTSNMSFSANAPLLLINDGFGGFLPPITVSSITGSVIYGIDMNGDGLDDLVSNTFGSGAAVDNFIDVALNTTTPGGPVTFALQPRTTFTTGGAFEGITGGDLDDDGLTELVVWFLSGGVQVFDVDGAGVVDLIPVITVPTGIDVAERALIIADLDVDGRPDVVTASRRILMNTTAPVTSGANSPTFTVMTMASAGSFPRYIAVGDVDGDRRPDVLRALNANCCARPGVVIDRQSSVCGSSSLSFDAPTSYARNTPFFGIEAADFDGDGRSEVVLSESTSGFQGLTVTRTDRVGNLPTDSFGQIQTGVSLGVGLAATADFDGDGAMDVFSAFQLNYQVHLNRTANAFSAKSAVHLEDPWITPPNFIYVDRNTTADPRDGSASAPYIRITAALGNANPGDVILVSPGRYACDTEDPTTLPGGSDRWQLDRIQLIGVAGPECTVLERIGIDAHESRVSGFTLRAPGGLVDGQTPPLIECTGSTITNNILLGLGPVDGIRVHSGTSNNIGGNVIYDCIHGIEVRPLAGVIAFPDASIYHNTLIQNSDGIVFSASGDLAIFNNVIVESSNSGVSHWCYDGRPIGSFGMDFNLVESTTGNDYQVVELFMAPPACTSSNPSPINPTGGPNRIRPASPTLFDWENLFEDPATLDFRHDSSLLVDAGTAATPLWLASDLDGDPRPTAGLGGADLGADEVASVKLTVAETDLGFTLTTSGLPVGAGEALALALGPSQSPIALFGTTFLVDPALIFYFTPGEIVDGSGVTTREIQWGPIGPPAGFRLHVQSIGLDGEALFSSNAVVITRR